MSNLVLFAVLFSGLAVTVFSAECEREALGPPVVCRCYKNQDFKCTEPRRIKCEEGGTHCPDGYACNCNGYCAKKVNMEIALTADDDAKMFICGEQVAKAHYNKLKTVKYEGPCDDLMVQVKNGGGGPSGAGVLVKLSDGKKYSTTGHEGPLVSGTTPLKAVMTTAPTGDWFENEPDYDYSGWNPPVVNTALNRYGTFKELAKLGGYTVSTKNQAVPRVKYGLKISLPFC